MEFDLKGGVHQHKLSGPYSNTLTIVKQIYFRLPSPYISVMTVVEIHRVSDENQ